jgi:glycosyltransferase involved in cell wall biosynthesis
MTNKKKMPKYPMVSICTPTYNRRPFYPMIIKCFENQKYPKDKLEWIIIDDGTDKIEDLVAHIPQVKYFKYDEKMYLGKKRNLAHEKSTGDIIIYMDDDDYYPPERISHAVETLRQNPKAMCAGSSEMYIYFKHIHKMYQFGPYGPNHATAATFAFRKELLLQSKYDDNAAVAEERAFLKNYTIPFVQLNPLKTILVFSHIQNSFDKKTLLDSPNPMVKMTDKTVDDFVKESDVKKFFMEDIDNILNNYEPGKVENKQDVIQQISELKEQRAKQAEEDYKKRVEYDNTINKIQSVFGANNNKINELNIIIQHLQNENIQLNDKVKYLEDKIKTLINEKIQTLKSSSKMT